jgi:hypothetical protein
MRYEFEYRRGGTLAYLAAWDVHHANLFDRVEPKTGIEPFGGLVERVMSAEPYASARRVFWVVDNGSSHAGRASIERLEGAYENLRLIHLPVHASWLNQIELYFSIVQRKALTPHDFGCLEELAERLLAFGRRYREIARRSNGRSRAPISSGCSRGSIRTSGPRCSWSPEAQAASRMPAGVLAKPTRTATASSRPARNSRREPLPRSTSAALASRSSTLPASA